MEIAHRSSRQVKAAETMEDEWIFLGDDGAGAGGSDTDSASDDGSDSDSGFTMIVRRGRKGGDQCNSVGVVSDDAPAPPRMVAAVAVPQPMLPGLSFRVVSYGEAFSASASSSSENGGSGREESDSVDEAIAGEAIQGAGIDDDAAGTESTDDCTRSYVDALSAPSVAVAAAPMVNCPETTAVLHGEAHSELANGMDQGAAEEVEDEESCEEDDDEDTDSSSEEDTDSCSDEEDENDAFSSSDEEDDDTGSSGDEEDEDTFSYGDEEDEDTFSSSDEEYTESFSEEEYTAEIYSEEEEEEDDDAECSGEEEEEDGSASCGGEVDYIESSGEESHDVDSTGEEEDDDAEVSGEELEAEDDDAEVSGEEQEKEEDDDADCSGEDDTESTGEEEGDDDPEISGEEESDAECSGDEDGVESSGDEPEYTESSGADSDVDAESCGEEEEEEDAESCGEEEEEQKEDTVSAGEEESSHVVDVAESSKKDIFAILFPRATTAYDANAEQGAADANGPAKERSESFPRKNDDIDHDSSDMDCSKSDEEDGIVDVAENGKQDIFAMLFPKATACHADIDDYEDEGDHGHIVYEEEEDIDYEEEDIFAMLLPKDTACHANIDEDEDEGEHGYINDYEEVKDIMLLSRDRAIDDDIDSSDGEEEVATATAAFGYNAEPSHGTRRPELARRAAARGYDDVDTDSDVEEGDDEVAADVNATSLYGFLTGGGVESQCWGFASQSRAERQAMWEDLDRWALVERRVLEDMRQLAAEAFESSVQQPRSYDDVDDSCDVPGTAAPGGGLPAGSCACARPAEEAPFFTVRHAERALAIEEARRREAAQRELDRALAREAAAAAEALESALRDCPTANGAKRQATGVTQTAVAEPHVPADITFIIGVYVFVYLVYSFTLFFSAAVVK